MSGTASDEDCTGESRTAWLGPYRQRLLEDAAVCFSPDRVKLLQKAFYIIHSFSGHHPEEDERVHGLTAEQWLWIDHLCQRAWEAGDHLPFDHYMAKPKDAKGKEYRLHHWPPTVHEMVAWDHDYDEDHHSQFEHWLTCVLFPEGPDKDHEERQFLNPRYKPNRLRSPEPLENLHLPERQGHELITQHELSNRLKAQRDSELAKEAAEAEARAHRQPTHSRPRSISAFRRRSGSGSDGEGESGHRRRQGSRSHLPRLNTDNPFGGGLPEPASSDAASFSPGGFKYAEDFELAWKHWKSPSKAAAEIERGEHYSSPGAYRPPISRESSPVAEGCDVSPLSDHPQGRRLSRFPRFSALSGFSPLVPSPNSAASARSWHPEVGKYDPRADYHVGDYSGNRTGPTRFSGFRESRVREQERLHSYSGLRESYGSDSRPLAVSFGGHSPTSLSDAEIEHDSHYRRGPEHALAALEGRDPTDSELRRGGSRGSAGLRPRRDS